MDRKAIGERIRLSRNEKGKTLQDIADDIGVAKSTIQRYEHGAIENIKLPVLEAIARNIGVNPEWILGKSDRKESIESIVLNRAKEALTKEIIVSLMTKLDISKQTEGEYLSLIEKYLASKKTPETSMIQVIADELDVNEAWLLGHDVPQKRGVFDKFLRLRDIPDYIKQYPNDEHVTVIRDTILSISHSTTEAEQTHLKKYRALDERGKQTIDTLLDMEYSRIDPATAVKGKLANTEKPAAKTDADIAIEETTAANADIERKLAEYRLELEAEQKARKLSALRQSKENVS